jgi:hypothetical protein
VVWSKRYGRMHNENRKREMEERKEKGIESNKKERRLR